MKAIPLIILSSLGLILISCSTTKSGGAENLIATMQVDEPIPGVCDNSRIIAIIPFPGNNQVKAKSPKSDEEIESMLIEQVTFLKDNPNFNGKGMVGLIVNCKGEMVRCKMDNKTESSSLDKEIVQVFSKLKKWTPGSVDGNAVDTSVLYSFTIENGIIKL